MYITRQNANPLIPEQEVASIFQSIITSSKVLPLFTRLPNMTSGTQVLKVVDQLPVAYFQNADTAMKKLTKMSWDKVFLYAGEIAVIVPIAQATLDDANYDVWAAVKPRLIEQAQKLIDTAILTGVGKPAEWRAGLLTSINDAGAIITPSSGQTLYSQINDAMAKVELSGYDVNGILGGVQAKSAFRMMLDTTGQPLNTTEIGSVKREFVNNGSWDNSKASLIVGDFSQAVYSIRQDAKFDLLTEGIIQDPVTGEILYNLAQQDMVALRMTMRLGWALPNPVNVLDDSEARFPFAAVKGTGSVASVNYVVKATSNGSTAIEGVKVVVGGIEKYTGSDGTATFKLPSGGDFLYKVSAPGYLPQFGEVVGASATTLTLTLKVDSSAARGKNAAQE